MVKDKSASATGAALIEVGIKTPDFQLADQNGKTHQLKAYLGKWVVLYFYPRDNTSGCTKEACQFQEDIAGFIKSKAVVMGVSPDGVESHKKFAGKYSLSFPILADLGSKVCSAYGVWQQKSMYGRKYMGVVRTTYLIDPRGKVAWRWDKVSVPGHHHEVLAKINALTA
jgi:peroxiredoxin Q/BCP